MAYETKIIKLDGRKLKADLPRLVRKINLTSRSNRGLMPSLKEPGNILHYESLFEHDTYLLHDHDPHALIVISQPRMGIYYNPMNNDLEEVYVDTIVVYENGMTILYEVKPEKILTKMSLPVDYGLLNSGTLKERKFERKKQNWQLKQLAIREFCKERGYKYMILTERRIQGQRLNNLKDLIKDAKHWSPDKINQFIPDFNYPHNLVKRIDDILREDPNLTIRELVDLLVLSYNNVYSIPILLSILKNLIYFGHLLIDWEVPFDESILKISNSPSDLKDSIVPVYDIPETLPSNLPSKPKVGEKKKFDESIISLLLEELEIHENYSSSVYTQEEINSRLCKETVKSLKPIFKSLSLKHSELTISEILATFGKWKKDRKSKQNYSLIKPIINQFHTSEIVTKSEILDFCTSENEFQSNGLAYTKKSAEKAYRLYINWRKRHVYGLTFKNSLKERKSKFPDEIRELIISYSKKWNTNQGFKLSYYKDLERETKKLIRSKLNSYTLKDVPSYHTFANYCNQLPKKEIHGKFEVGVQNTIKRSLSGKYLEGRFPGCLIQIDHTQLDIWIVNYADRKAYVRPWITLAVDVYSRAIWGVYISDQPPNQESNIKCLLSGILMKNTGNSEEWGLVEKFAVKNGIDVSNLDWIINGLPARIQVDNGKDFDSRLMKEFCTKLGITLEFRPIKTPEYGGFIESIWDTINDTLRSRYREFGGVVFSIPKERKKRSRVKWTVPKNYDPKETARMTMDMIREWLMAYFVIYYNREPHSGQSHSPNQFWTDGVSGIFPRPPGGELLSLSPELFNPDNPIQSQQLYELYTYWEVVCKPIDPNGSGRRVISESGIRTQNFFYTSDIFKIARKSGLFNHEKFADGQKVLVRYTREDVRHIWIEHKGGIMKLTAYKYMKDDAIWQIVERAISGGYNISNVNIGIMENLLEISKIDGHHVNDAELEILRQIALEFKDKGRINMEYRKFLQDNFPGLTIAGAILEIQRRSFGMYQLSALDTKEGNKVKGAEVTEEHKESDTFDKTDKYDVDDFHGSINFSEIDDEVLDADVISIDRISIEAINDQVQEPIGSRTKIVFVEDIKDVYQNEVSRISRKDIT